jgi:hypothetical protein
LIIDQSRVNTHTYEGDSSFLHFYVCRRLFKSLDVELVCCCFIEGVLAVETLAVLSAAPVVLFALAVALETPGVLAIAASTGTDHLTLPLQTSLPQLHVFTGVRASCARTDIRRANFKSLKTVAVALGTAILIAATFKFFGLNR